MDLFQDFLAKIGDPHRAEMEAVLRWVMERFPNLVPRLAWNQPMFTDHGTFIIGFSTSKNHFAVAPERAAMLRFAGEIEAAGHDHAKEILRFKWNAPVDYALLARMIEFNLQDKADCATFWRK